MKRITSTVLFVLASLTMAIPAFGQGQIELESDRQRKLLKAMDRAEGCPEESLLRSIDPAVDSLLVNLLNEKEAPMHYRLYAVDCLGYFSNKRSLQVISSLLGDPTWDKVYRHRAMSAAARSMGAEVLDDLKEACNDRDSETRAAAARAIGLIHVPRARAFLQHLKIREQNPAVLQAITESLKRIPTDPLRRPDTGI